MIDLLEEKLIRLAQVPKLPALDAVRPSVRTVHRWASTGCKGIKLETTQRGGLTCTSEEAVQRFFDKLTAPFGSSTPTPGEQRKAQKRAKALLSKYGI